jgi:hypothetical protein
MAKKCPPGVFCIENMTLIIILLIIIASLIYLTRFLPNQNQNQNVVRDEIVINQEPANRLGIFPRASYGFSNLPNDVLLNPYEAPLRDQRVVQTNDIRGGIPINVPTQSVDTNYRQVGLLTRLNGPQTILPLMGRPLFTNRDKWNFYTQSDQNNSVKLPITFKGRSCTNEYGCDDVSNGDTVYVEGYNDAFKCTLYDNAQPRYIPFV